MEFPDLHLESSIEISKWKSGNSMAKRAIFPDFHLLEKDIRLSSSTVYRQNAQLRSEKGTNNRKKGTGMKKEVNQDIIFLLKKQIKKDNSQTIAKIT